MEFRLLGPFEVRIGGRVVPEGPPKHRVLLATLLVSAGRPVPMGRLVDAIWGAAPPGNPRRAVQVYVTRLRAMLERAQRGAGASIVTRANGYLIDVAADRVDLLRFQHGLDKADQATDPDKQAAALSDALAEWRGEPLVDVPSDLLQEEVAPGLRERYLLALERRIDVNLCRGRHAATVSELVTLTEQHPLRERLWGLLIVALDGCGRRADALATYQRLRRRLADDLGVDPSDELQRLHVSILAEGATAAPAAARPAGLPPVPRQLPPDVRGFVGRTELLARLDRLMPADDCAVGAVVISAIAGTAGVGKTALAVHWARRAADAFPDGQLYLNLRGYHPGQAVTPAQALSRFLRALGVPAAEIPLEVEDQAALYRSLIDGRRMLVVLDNAGSPEQVRPLLPGAPGCLVLVTSRDQLGGLVATEAVELLTLDVMTESEALQLLAARLGAARIAAEPAAAAEIVVRCARLPLALAIVAARAAAHPMFSLQTLAAELREVHGRLDSFGSGEAATDMRTVFSWSYRTLSETAARLFRLLGLHPGPDVAVRAAASLAGTPVTRVRMLLSELTRAHLVNEHAPGRYTFHDLLRVYAAELAAERDTEAERRAAAHRLLDHYLHTAHAAALQLHPGRDPIAVAEARPGTVPEPLPTHEKAMDWFTAERVVLLAAIEQAAAEGWDVHVWQLAWSVTNFLYRRGYWRDRLAVEHAAVAAARRLGDPVAQVMAHRNLAGAYTWLGRYDDADAHYRSALDLATETGNDILRARIHEGLAFLLGRQRRRQAHAVEHCRQALAIYETAGHRTGQADALNQMASLQGQLGEHTHAIGNGERALALHENLNNRYGQAATWDTLGYSRHHLGEHAQAVACYQRSLALLTDIGERYPQAEVLGRIGDTHNAAGDQEAARVAWRQALDILVELDHPDATQVRAKLLPPG